MSLRYFYQVDLNGDPIQGSNTALIRKPTTGGKGQRFVEYVPVGKSLPCCSTGGLTVTSLHKKWRYYVRLSETTKLPISGTLEKHQQKPKSYFWQEVIARRQCATTPQFNATLTWHTTTPKTINLNTALDLSINHYTFSGFVGSTNEGHMTLVLGANGNLVITQTSPSVAHTDTVTLYYTNNSACTFAFQMTFVYTP